jgi:hypothetical protein
MKTITRLAAIALVAAPLVSGVANAQPATPKAATMQLEQRWPGGEADAELRGIAPVGFGANDIAVDYDAAGLWRYTAGSWSQLTTSDPEAITACCVGLAGDFGAAAGLWFYGSAGWSSLTPSNPDEMVCWNNQIAASFDPGQGLWLYDCASSTWSQPTTTSPEHLSVTPTSLLVDFGASGLWRYNADGWEQLGVSNPAGIVYGMDGVAPGVPKTGQAGCWGVIGDPVNCSGTGQDGEYLVGIVSPDPRFTDNGDGTVTDNLTGLIWLKNANCFPSGSWAGALESSNTLASGSCELTDRSAAGDWRLPNFRELQSLLDYTQHDPPLPEGHPFSVVPPNRWWSSTSFAGVTSFAWSVSLTGGFGTINDKTTAGYVWPVRGPE